MVTISHKIDDLAGELALLVQQKLQDMVASEGYYTKPSYSANTTLYPDNLVPFVDKHMNYLRDRPKLDPENYLANLRLMTKIR